MTAIKSKERSILFSGTMVRALLDGSKTQTRRALKITPRNSPGCVPYCADNGKHFRFPVSQEDFKKLPKSMQQDERSEGAYYYGPCPYGQPGERLWVRETLYFDKCGEEWCYVAGNDPVMADPYTAPILLTEGRKFVPSIHMPREASRLLLEITDVRCERLQDISEADAVAEGIDKFPIEGWEPEYDAGCYKNYLWSPKTADKQAKAKTSAEESYESLWASINGPDSWAANPWVWVVTFKIITSG